MNDIDRLLPRSATNHASRAIFLAGMAALAAASLRPATARAAAPLIIEGKGDWLFPAWESLTDAGMSGIASSIRTIDAARRTFSAAGIQLLVLVVPLKARFYPDKLPDGVALSPDVVARYGNILTELTTASIPTFDVAAVMKTISQPAFFRTDYHWTEWSAEAVAQACAQHVLSLAPLPPFPTPMPPLSAFSQDKHVGDLAELLPPARQKAVGEEDLTVRSIDASRVQLLDSSNSDVHVVGNSFSMPYLGFPEMLAETLKRPVGVTAKFGNAGPWQTMVEYLESPVFVKRHPRVIVWQFVEGLLTHGPASTGFWDVTSLMSDQTFLGRVAKAVPAQTNTPG